MLGCHRVCFLFLLLVTSGTNGAPLRGESFSKIEKVRRQVMETTTGIIGPSKPTPPPQKAPSPSFPPTFHPTFSPTTMYPTSSPTVSTPNPDPSPSKMPAILSPTLNPSAKPSIQTSSPSAEMESMEQEEYQNDHDTLNSSNAALIAGCVVGLLLLAAAVAFLAAKHKQRSRPARSPLQCLFDEASDFSVDSAGNKNNLSRETDETLHSPPSSPGAINAGTSDVKPLTMISENGDGGMEIVPAQ